MKITKYCIGTLLLSLGFAASFGLNPKNDVDQEVRTVHYEDKSIDENSLFKGFDSHQINENDNGLEIVAEKFFDKSIFEEFDLVDLADDTEEIQVCYSVNYVENESTVYLSVYFKEDESKSLIDTLPGLITFNEYGETDVMFLIDNEKVWLSDLTHEDSVIENTGLFKKLLKKAADAIVSSTIAQTAIKAVTLVVNPVIRLVSTTLYLSPVGSLATWITAKALDMDQEWKNGLPTGIYHARFDCWQDCVGYDDFYDEVFDLGTELLGRKRMQRHKYEIDIDGDYESDYIFWAWKGDYYNLGAGCELGIYHKVQNKNFGLVWEVDKNASFSCQLNLKFNGKTIIDWNNSGKKHWWFTGFNSNYQFPILTDIDKLKATFTVTFDSFSDNEKNQRMYDNFIYSYNHTKKINPNWNCWTINGKNSNGYNVATLSF